MLANNGSKLREHRRPRTGHGRPSVASWMSAWQTLADQAGKEVGDLIEAQRGGRLQHDQPSMVSSIWMISPCRGDARSGRMPEDRQYPCDRGGIVRTPPACWREPPPCSSQPYSSSPPDPAGTRHPAVRRMPGPRRFRAISAIPRSRTIARVGSHRPRRSVTAPPRSAPTLGAAGRAAWVLATGPHAVMQALMWRQWIADIVLFQHTAPATGDEQRRQLTAQARRDAARHDLRASRGCANGQDPFAGDR